MASGELGTGIIQSSINADGQFLNLMLDPTVAGRDGGFAKPGSVSQFADSDDEAAAYASMRPANAGEREAYAMATKAPMLASLPANRWSASGRPAMAAPRRSAATPSSALRTFPRGSGA
jgi:hypothetical protein